MFSYPGLEIMVVACNVDLGIKASYNSLFNMNQSDFIIETVQSMKKKKTEAFQPKLESI